MATIRIFFEKTLLPPGTAEVVDEVVNPPAVTLMVKNDAVPFHKHPGTDAFEVVRRVETTLASGEVLDTLLKPFSTAHPAVTQKDYTAQSNPTPHEDLLQQTNNGNDLLVRTKVPTVSGKETTYTLALSTPPFLTIKVRRQ